MAYSVRMLKINDFSKICFFTLCQMLTHKEKTNQNEKKRTNNELKRTKNEPTYCKSLPGEHDQFGL